MYTYYIMSTKKIMKINIGNIILTRLEVVVHTETQVKLEYIIVIQWYDKSALLPTTCGFPTIFNEGMVVLSARTLHAMECRCGFNARCF